MRFLLTFAPARLGGAVQISSSLLAELRRAGGDHRYLAVLSPQLDDLTDRSQFDERFEFTVLEPRPTALGPALVRARRIIGRVEQSFAPHAVFSVFGPAMWRPGAPHLVGFANGLFLFDRSRFIRDTELSDPLSALRYRIRRSLMMHQVGREADAWWVETDYARNALATEIGVDPNRIRVISNTYAAQFEQAEFAAPAEPGEGQPFRFAYLAARYPHKNFGLIRQVLPLLAERGLDVEFLLTLSPAEVEAELGTDPLVAQHVVALGSIPPDEVPDVYRRVHATFVPSLLEIFTGAYPESMRASRPLLTSDLPFARDLCGDAAAYFDPWDAEAAADAIERFVADRDRRLALVAAGRERLERFDTPADRAAAVVSTLEEIAVARVAAG